MLLRAKSTIKLQETRDQFHCRQNFYTFLCLRNWRFILFYYFCSNTARPGTFFAIYRLGILQIYFIYVQALGFIYQIYLLFCAQTLEILIILTPWLITAQIVFAIANLPDVDSVVLAFSVALPLIVLIIFPDVASRFAKAIAIAFGSYVVEIMDCYRIYSFICTGKKTGLKSY